MNIQFWNINFSRVEFKLVEDRVHFGAESKLLIQQKMKFKVNKYRTELEK